MYVKNRSLQLSGREVLSGVLVAALVLLAANWTAQQVRSSDLYRRSRLISMIMAQEQVGVLDMVNSRNIDLMLKFVGALTSAYIDFELIPVGETGTFAAVFDSIPPEIEIDKFEYHRKDLSIIGRAPTQQAYEQFLSALQETGYFESASGYYRLTEGDEIHFELRCIAKTAQAYFGFPS